MPLFSNNNLPGSWFQAGGGNGSATTNNLGNAFANAFNLSAAEGTRQFEMNYALKKKEIDQQYKVALMNARTQADVAKANARYQQQQYELAKETLAFERDKFAQTHALNQAQLGYSVLGTAAQLRGPSNYFQAANFARGAAGNPQTSTFLEALQKNQRLAGFGAQAGLPEKETLGTLSAKLTGGPGMNDQNYLAQIGNIAAKGAHQLGAGSLEQLTPTELGLFTSGLDELGLDTSTFLDQYRRSRVGQSVGANRAA